MFYLRFSENIQKDLAKGTSYHYTGINQDGTEETEELVNENGYEYNEEAEQYVLALGGLCAFELEAETLEEAIEEATEFRYNYVYNAESMPYWHILTGEYVGDCPEGDVISNVTLVHSNTI